MSAPEFKLKHQEELKRIALKNAHQRMIERFNVECQVMGVNFSDYEIVSWNVNYGHGPSKHSPYSNVRNTVGAAAATSEFAGDEIEIHASKAIVTVYLNGIFAKKEQNVSQ